MVEEVEVLRCLRCSLPLLLLLLLNGSRLLLIIDGIVVLNGCNFKLNFQKQKYVYYSRWGYLAWDS